MKTRLDQWLQFLSIDENTLATLREFLPAMTPHLDPALDTLYRQIAANPTAAAMFRSSESMRRAREHQKMHWARYVMPGNFGEEYLAATRTIGQTHYRLGVDLRFYMGAYSLVMSELVQAVMTAIPGHPEDQHRYLSALHRVSSLDMGLSTTVYYEFQVNAFEQMAHELNFALARAGEFRDNETGSHLTRMSRMCQALALAAGQDIEWAQMIQVASPLHDVGKIGIPDTILLKPGKLTDEEMEVMRKHPTIGGSIIPDHPAAVIRMARRIAVTHHERWDGTGYPTGLKGEEIPLEGRIASICDVFDALVSARPYKEAWPTEKAVEYIKANSGAAFDPSLVTAFLSILPEIDAIQNQFVEDGEEARRAAVLTG